MRLKSRRNSASFYIGKIRSPMVRQRKKRKKGTIKGYGSAASRIEEQEQDWLDYCFSDQALWSRFADKIIISSNITCSSHDVGNNLLISVKEQSLTNS